MIYTKCCGCLLYIFLTYSCSVKSEPPGTSKLELKATLAKPQVIFLRGETISDVGLTLCLTNTGDASTTVTDFKVARTKGDLKIEITGPRGRPIAQISQQVLKDSRDWHFDIKRSATKVETLPLKYFGYYQFHKVGEHAIKVSFTPRPTQTKLVAKVIKVQVIDVKKSNILSTQMAAPEINRLDGDTIPLIQQIKIGSKVYLYYRIAIRKDGQMSEAHWSKRLCELPSKVEMKVEGVYGMRKSLTITYQNPNSPKDTIKLVINSIDGMLSTD